MDHPTRLIAALALAFASVASWAQALPAVTYPAQGLAQVNVGPLNFMPAANARTVALASDGVRILDNHVARVAANDIAVQQGRNLTTLGVVRVLGRVGARMLPVVGAVAALGAVFCETSSNGWLCDPLQNPVNMARWGVSPFNPANPTFGSPEAAAAAQFNTGRYAVSGTIVCTGSLSSRNCSVPYTYTYGDGTTASSVGAVYVEQGQKLLCPAVAGVPGYAEAGGATVLGKCPTGGKVAATEADELARIAPALQPAIVPIVQRALTSGIDLSEALKPVPSTLTGPATLALPPVTTTTTTPTGQPATTTQNQQLTFNYNPTTNTFNWTTVTTTTAPDGTTETKEEVPKEEEDKRSECEKNPNSLACAETDTPDGPEMEQQDLPVTFTPDGGWGADSASCPPPLTGTFMGQTITVENVHMCTFLQALRPLVIASAALAGALIFMGGIKS